MHLKSLALASLFAVGASFSTAAASTASIHLAAQQANTAQAVFAIQTAIPLASKDTPFATLVPTHQGAPRFIGALDFSTDAVLGGTVLTVLVLGMWFGRCYGNGRKE